MLITSLILVLLSPLLFVPVIVETRFSPDDLAEMGIYFENSQP